MEVIGLDIGFGYTKCTNGSRFLVFKSVYGGAIEPQFREQLITEGAEDDYLHFEVDGRGYFVGELAERQSAERYFTLDQGQFIGEFTRVLALCALARMVERQDPVRIVAGLPIGHFARHREDLTAALKGQHDVVVIDRGGERTPTVVRVAELRVVPQPFGALMNLMLNDIGEVKDKRFLQQKIGIIDIGFRTADFTISDRARYSERGSLTTESGISRAFATIAAKLQETSGVNVELYRMFDAVDRGTIKIHGKRYDLKRITEQAFSQLANKIAVDVNRLWANDWDLDTIVISGGGGSVLAPYLQPQLKGEVLALEPGRDARMNNVRGYVKYAKRLWTRGPNPPADTAEIAAP